MCIRDSRETVDLILLDLNMPGMGGLATCRAIRNGWDVPVIVVSVRSSDQDKVQALDAGADDYMCKPFSFNELMARMRAAFRRSGFATDTAPRKISAQGLEVDFANRKVVAGGKVVRLTPTEFDILRYMAGQPNKPIPVSYTHLGSGISLTPRRTNALGIGTCRCTET